MTVVVCVEVRGGNLFSLLFSPREKKSTVNQSEGLLETEGKGLSPVVEVIPEPASPNSILGV